MVDINDILEDEDSGYIQLPMPGATTDPQTGVTDFSFGVAPPLTQQQKIDAYGPSGRDIVSRNVISNMSNLSATLSKNFCLKKEKEPLGTGDHYKQRIKK